MWFDPSTLINAISPVATSAISETCTLRQNLKVANVATVSNLRKRASLNLYAAHFEKLGKSSDSIAAKPVTKSKSALMTEEEGRAIRNWLEYIDEDEPEIIMFKCQVDHEALRYFLFRSTEVPTVCTNRELHSCNNCRRLSQSGVCNAAIKLGAMYGYRPVLGLLYDHRCPEWLSP